MSCTQTSAAGADGAPDVIRQLRIYEIFDRNKQAFHQRFRDDAMRIMARYDFRVVATWESRQGNRTEFHLPARVAGRSHDEGSMGEVPR
jgi:hypothetical protein